MHVIPACCMLFDFHICFWVFFHLILLQSVRKLQKDLAEKLSSKRCHSFPALKRGDVIDRYFPTAGMVILGVVILEVLLRSVQKHYKCEEVDDYKFISQMHVLHFGIHI